MSRHFIVDGYNVLHSTDRWVEFPREKQREKFLEFLDESGLVGSESNSLTVVLDGYAAKLKNIRFRRVRLIFSGDRDADTVIKEWVADRPNPKDVIVVTNDRGVQSAVRGSGARVMSANDFLKLGKKKTSRVSHSEKPDSKDLESINQELKRIWKC